MEKYMIFELTHAPDCKEVRVYMYLYVRENPKTFPQRTLLDVSYVRYWEGWTTEYGLSVKIAKAKQKMLHRYRAQSKWWAKVYGLCGRLGGDRYVLVEPKTEKFLSKFIDKKE